jgi:hypothetical protein
MSVSASPLCLNLIDCYVDAEAIFRPRLEKPVMTVAVAEDFAGVGQYAVRFVAASPAAIRNGESLAVAVDAGVSFSVEF